MSPVKFNPAFLSDDELVASFVARKRDLELLMNVVRENTGSSNQHPIVIGPRGSGKTTLARRVVIETSRDPELAPRWYPIVFGEESYSVTTPGEFWLEAIFQLAQQTGDADWRRTHDEIARQWQDEDLVRERALGQLIDFADHRGKRLLLVVENLDSLLGDQLSDDNAWKLRHTLQNEPRIMLLATATRRFPEIDDASHALYEIFRPHPLPPLDAAACRDVWNSLTGRTVDARGTRPLEIITGGNLRLLTLLARVGPDAANGELLEGVLRLIDDHTEYFKSQLDALPPIERKVYLALADLWCAATARDVAAAAHQDVNKTSSLLRRLVQRGVVTTLDDDGRTNWYQLSERTFNLYHLLRRRGGPSRRVRGLLEFMARFYRSTPTDSLAEQEDRWLVDRTKSLAARLQASDSPETDVDALDEATSVFLEFGVRDRTDVALRRLEELDVPSLRPLEFGLRDAAGEPPTAAIEMNEVAHDIAALIARRREERSTD